MSYRDFRDAYVDAMLWANTYGYDENTGEVVSVDMLQGGDTILLSEEDRNAQGPTEEAMAQMREDASAFWYEIVEITGDQDEDHRPNWPVGYSDSLAGHDFALTRNGHGAGYWDRGLGELGDKLTDAASAWGETSLYVENGEIHHD